MSKFKTTLLSLLIASTFNEGLLSQNHPINKDLYEKILVNTSFQVSKNIKERHIQYLNLNGEPMAVYITEAKLKKNKLSLEATTPFDKDTFAMQTLQNQMKWKNNPNNQVLVGINADFFNMKTGEPVQMAIRNGEIIKKR